MTGHRKTTKFFAMLMSAMTVANARMTYYNYA